MAEEYVPQNLAGLIACQDDSVVSKTLIKRKVGTVSLFAFDKGQGLSEHTAPFDAMVQVLDGVAEVVIAGNAMRVCAGEMIVMPADAPHALTAIEPFKMLLIMIKG